MCEIGPGQRVYLENQGAQTVITTVNAGSGQQQQASSSIYTGTWTRPPQIVPTTGGIAIQLATVTGDRVILVQGSHIHETTELPSLTSSQQIQMQQVDLPASTMPPMQPMQPMTMGDMQMSMNPMEMQMGNMTLRMGSSAAASTSTAGTQGTQRFCSQCGNAVQPDDRFCARCGHQLT